MLYVSMPPFHSNAVMSGYAPALATGATLALAERFSASGFLDDVRHFGATYMNYVGKPLSYILATPEHEDDAANPLRIAFGNEANEKDIAAFATRFGCDVRDGFGSTENAVIISRVEDTPPGSFGPQGEVTNLHECVGELINTQGAGRFAGYYAGRTGDWLRVDGENLAAAPVERILLLHPEVSRVAVYAVPDPTTGDQLVAALVLRPGATLDPASFEEFLAAQPDLGPKQWPRHVRIARTLPQTATNKVLKRELVTEGLDVTDPVWTRAERGTAYSR